MRIIWMNVSIIIPLLLNISCNQSDELNKSDASSEKAEQSMILSSSSLNKNDSLFFIEEGTTLAKKMYAGLLTHLKKALDEQGAYEAVKYCNLKALNITDSLSKNFGIKAKRTSLKLRNIKNAPDELEKQVLQMYEQTQSKTPIVVATQEGVRFFTPIYVAHTCVNCHGVPNQDIAEPTLTALNKLYPDDKAKNYSINDIRGIWSITFPKNYQSKLNSISKN